MSKPHYLSARRRMRVIGRNPLAQALDEAVDIGLGAEVGAFDHVDLRQVQRAIRREFGRLVRERADSVSSVPKSALMAELEAGRGERPEAPTTEPRARHELRALPTGTGTSEPLSVGAPGETGSLTAEREAQYERRIAKLTESLARAEQALQRMADGEGVETGLASVFRTVQGLSSEDDQYLQKHAVLSRLLEENLALRQRFRASHAG